MTFIRTCRLRKMRDTEKISYGQSRSSLVIAPREPSPLTHVDSEHPSRSGENDLSAAGYLSAASSGRGAFKINLTETKRDRSISIVGAEYPNGRALVERSCGKERRLYIHTGRKRERNRCGAPHGVSIFEFSGH